ncbi:MAG: hypothetical protein J7J17_04220 [Hadesarchaea archaeon]|nr:hypothetical protein [Hadesarchaea archaeon]
MDQGGLANFLMGKIGVWLAVGGIITATLSMTGSFERTARSDELKAVLKCVTDALREIDRLPGEAWVERELPRVSGEFKLDFVGNRGGAQLVRVMIGGENLERIATLSTEVNGGEFEFTHENPRVIRLTKRDGRIHMEVF